MRVAFTVGEWLKYKLGIHTVSFKKQETYFIREDIFANVGILYILLQTSATVYNKTAALKTNPITVFTRETSQ